MYIRFKNILSFVVLLLLITPSFSQKIDKQLDAKLVQLAKDFKGEIGWAIYSVNKHKGSWHNADTVFPTASIVKVPILMGIMEQLKADSLSYTQPLIYKDSLLYAGEDILGSFKNNETITLNKVIMLMLTTSDNTASLWLQSLAGGGERINQFLESYGYTNTKVNSRTPGRRPNWENYGWGQTTPNEMTNIFEKMVQRQLIDEGSSNQMLRLLSRNLWDANALSSIPAGVFVASKNGAVDASRSEVIYVNGGKNPYIFSVFTKNNVDKSWKETNEAWLLLKAMSQVAWDHYN